MREIRFLFTSLRTSAHTSSYTLQMKKSKDKKQKINTGVYWYWNPDPRPAPTAVKVAVTLTLSAAALQAVAYIGCGWCQYSSWAPHKTGIRCGDVNLGSAFLLCCYDGTTASTLPTQSFYSKVPFSFPDDGSCPQPTPFAKIRVCQKCLLSQYLKHRGIILCSTHANCNIACLCLTGGKFRN